MKKIINASKNKCVGCGIYIACGFRNILFCNTKYSTLRECEGEASSRLGENSPGAVSGTLGRGLAPS
jgi:Fe-S-cluster-containing dehydrogenase component